MTQNLSIKSRLVFVIGFLAGLVLLMGLGGWLALRESNNATESVYTNRLMSVGYLDKVIRHENLIQMLLTRAANDSPDTYDKSLAQIKDAMAGVDKEWKAYDDTPSTPAEEALMKQFVTARAKYYEECVKPAIEAMREKNNLLIGDIMQSKIVLFAPVMKNMDDLIKLQFDESEKEFNSSQTMFKSFSFISLLAMLLAAGVGITMGAWLVRSITKPLNYAVDIARNIALGDLTQTIRAENKDETGVLLHALQDMNEALVRTVAEVRTATDTITTASAEIASGNLDLSSRTEEQVASLEETASSMEELTSTVKQNADNARQANQLVVSASDFAKQGGQVVSEVVQTMGAIKESSSKIVDIIGVIDGIAFQTNILALNAAVEAARAGEQGRGFAVVAAEVRNLAQRSAGAAKEIKELIGDSVEKVDAGARLVDTAGSTMQQIVASVSHVADIMSEITAASQEQSSGIEQVNLAITQMDETTQQNAALVEEAAAAAQSMQDQAANLSQVVSVFKLAGHHMGSAPVKKAAPAAVPKKAGATTPTQRNKAPASAPRVAAPKLEPKAAVVKPAASTSNDDWEEF